MYANKKQSEFRFVYFDERNKYRWFSLDYLIKKYKINIEYNGSMWHPNDKNPNKFKNISLWDEYKNKWENRVNILSKNGYKIFIVWDTDINRETNEMEILNKLCKQIEDYINENFK